jgi:hypothetical protein
MKRIASIISIAFFICLIPFSIATGQDKKKEQKVRIVINDGSGTKVAIDTLITDGKLSDTIKLKDGKVIYIGDPDNMNRHKTKEGPENIFITVNSDGDDSKEEVSEITVISSDSADIDGGRESGSVYVYNNSKGHRGKSGGRYKVITSTSDDSADNGDRIIYIKEGKDRGKETDKKFDVYVSRDDNDSDVEMTRYVIAKDGMVVTVEGRDEAKARELIKEIEEKMGVKGNGSDKKVTVKSETKKTVK